MAITYPLTVPAEQAFMGKARTYSAQTNYRQYAVRLRAMVDNPRNPNITGAIGSDWAVDEPHAIVEEGSNVDGSYVIKANDEVDVLTAEKNFAHTNPDGGHIPCTFSLPLKMTVKKAELSSINIISSTDGRGHITSLAGAAKNTGGVISYTVAISLLSNSTSPYTAVYRLSLNLQGLIA